MTSLLWKSWERANSSFLLFASLCIIYLTEFATALRHLLDSSRVIYLSVETERTALPPLWKVRLFKVLTCLCYSALRERRFSGLMFAFSNGKERPSPGRYRDNVWCYRSACINGFSLRRENQGWQGGNPGYTDFCEPQRKPRSIKRVAKELELRYIGSEMEHYAADISTRREGLFSQSGTILFYSFCLSKKKRRTNFWREE